MTIAEMTAKQLVELDYDSLSEEDFRAARSRLDELRAETDDKRDAQRRRQETARDAKREDFERDTLPELEAEHGAVGVGLVVVWWHKGAAAGAVVLKRPQGITMRKFLDRKEIKTEDAERLCKPCIVHPSKEEASKLFEEHPALMVQCASRLYELSRAAKEAEGKG